MNCNKKYGDKGTCHKPLFKNQWWQHLLINLQKSRKNFLDFPFFSPHTFYSNRGWKEIRQKFKRLFIVILTFKLLLLLTMFWLISICECVCVRDVSIIVSHFYYFHSYQFYEKVQQAMTKILQARVCCLVFS